MSEKNNLAILDLDGTLFDTREVNYAAYREALKPFGCSLDAEFFKTRCNGRHYTEFLPEIMKTDDRAVFEEVHRRKKGAYAGHLGKARENRHLFEILMHMRDSYYLAVVTTASRRNTEEILRHFHYDTLFDLLLTQEDITRVKPDPQGFLMAMAHFGVDAAHTVIFEDSDVGLQAAKAAGASVFGVMQI
ncbi:MAG: HAD family phosphatase [Lachnospiraceae bacterium]|nr:HAD family phosphatase [Lachnospiraceae bacterium]